MGIQMLMLLKKILIIFYLTRTHCALHIFITEFTRDVFLSQIHIEMGTALDEATRKLDMWKSVNPTESLQSTKATRPLLQVVPNTSADIFK